MIKRTTCGNSRGYSFSRDLMNRAIGAGCLTLAVLGWACSSQPLASGDGGFADSGVGETGKDPGPVVCPAEPQDSGTPCPKVGLECEYGGDPDPSCTFPAYCESSGLWNTHIERGTCSSANRPGCPATFAEVPVGTACSNLSDDCIYPEGFCFCTSQCGDGGFQRVWYCQPTPTGCPPPRPMRGTACSSEGQVCDYGSCDKSYLKQTCLEGIWQLVL